MGRSEVKTDSSRRGGLKSWRIVRQKRQSSQVNCIADFGVEATEDVVESIRRKMECGGRLAAWPDVGWGVLPGPAAGSSTPG